MIVFTAIFTEECRIAGHYTSFAAKLQPAHIQIFICPPVDHDYIFFLLVKFIPFTKYFRSLFRFLFSSISQKRDSILFPLAVVSLPVLC